MAQTRRSASAKVLIAVSCSLAIAAAVGLSRGRPANAEPPAGSHDPMRSIDIRPDALLDWALGQLIYDVPDDSDGASSAVRGHSLARTMYGYNDQVLNSQPFNGTGRLHFVHPPGFGAISGADDYHLINYQRFDGDSIRDPERYGTRADLLEPRPFFTGGFNASYTYPDANSLFLAAVRADGTLITPSFHREWIFGSLDGSNPNWTTPAGRYLVLRPRPADMGQGFPVPPDSKGDVKNFVGAPGGNDSVWIDLGFPVQQARDGRKFKPLFAFLVVDLDNRVNVNVHGNVLTGHGGDHGSGQGWGRWEVAPSTTPWLWDRARESFYGVPTGDPEGPPVGPEVPFPGFDRRGDPSGNPGQPVPRFSDLRTPGRPADDPEADWRGFRGLSLVAQGVDIPAPDPDDRAQLHKLAAALQSRVDLDTPLPPYPGHEPFVTSGQRERALAAQRSRQHLAEAIYRQLLLVTGVGPVPDAAIQDPPDLDLAPRRWLAQLAVNIVDYIDEDDISTPFNFYSPVLDGLHPDNVAQSTVTPDGERLPRYWVFGTELPRVVLNEVMTEYRLPADQTIPGAVSVKVWAELYRPVFDVPAPDPVRPPDAQPVRLFVPTGDPGGYSPYRVVIANTNRSPRTPLFDHPDNVLGSPDQVHGITEFPAMVGTVGNPDTRVPAALGPDRYLIVGPKSDGGQDARGTIRPTETRPAATRWHRSDDMEYRIEWRPGDPGDPGAPVTVLLRRLANPHLPPDSRPVVEGAVNPFYNPYITVDYLEGVPLRNAEANNQSTGKLQPFASHVNRVQGQTAEQGGGTRHTLGEANQPRQAPFDWLVHLDRQLISPAELLSVSGVRPHQLTHRFITTPPGDRADHAHRVSWFDEDLPAVTPPHSHRLWRLFEFLETPDRSPAPGPHGRAPGKLNLNTIYDFETFRGVFGPQRGGQFDIDQVHEIWTRLLQLRSPGMLDPEPTVTETDRPFLSSGVGILPAADPQANRRGVNINDTIFRAWDPDVPGDPRRLFTVAGQDHPYRQNELLTTIYDRVTTRSNVFAVWLTVGFFEVTDDVSHPVKLGSEIGRAENRQVRHRFFAIVDRTNLQLFGLQGGGDVTRYLTRSDEQGGAVPGEGRHWVRLEALSGLTATEKRDAGGAPTGQFLPWNIAAGSYLFIDVGPQREMVLVTDVDATKNAIEAVFGRSHPAGSEISIPGNPGPQPDFDSRAALFRDVIRWTVTLE